MDTMLIKNEDGSIEAVPMLRFRINMFDKETYILIGAETTGCEIKMPETGFIAERLGRLSELHDTLRLEVTENMLVNEWECDRYPDPDVILITAPRINFNNN